MKPFRLAVMASGNGSNFSAIQQATQDGRISGEIVCLIYDSKEAFVKERAKQAGVPSFYVSLKASGSKTAYEQQIVQILQDHQIDCVILAGYMKIVGETLLAAYEGKMLNIHPAYLPEFPGKQGILDAFNAGVSQTGVTVHLVDEGVDTGKILLQERVPVLPEDSLDSLAERIHQVEHRLYPQAIEAFLTQFEKE